MTFLVAVGVTGLGSLAFAYMMFAVTFEYGFLKEIVHDHFAAIMGLPLAAAVAFVLVIFLRQAAGPIQFEGLGFKFNAAAGQVVMWVVCFLALAGAIRLCW
jgi:hypothetical protein